MPAIVHVANSSQELGNAIADVLFGDYNPGGRTTTTWYQSETDIPTEITDYDIKKGTTYWYFTGTPLYPFGHGLSYSTFEYSNLTTSAAVVSTACGAVEVGVDVTNTGAVDGRRGRAALRRVSRVRRDSGRASSCAAFRRVGIAAGATARVSFALHAADLSFFDQLAGQFVVETGRLDRASGRGVIPRHPPARGPGRHPLNAARRRASTNQRIAYLLLRRGGSRGGWLSCPSALVGK